MTIVMDRPVLKVRAGGATAGGPWRWGPMSIPLYTTGIQASDLLVRSIASYDGDPSYSRATLPICDQSRDFLCVDGDGVLRGNHGGLRAAAGGHGDLVRSSPGPCCTAVLLLQSFTASRHYVSRYTIIL